MKKVARALGFFLCVAGLLLAGFCAVEFVVLQKDPTGAVRQYNQAVADYDTRLQELSRADPRVPSSGAGKTFSQARKEDALFFLIVAALLFSAGVAIIVRRRPAQRETTSDEREA